MTAPSRRRCEGGCSRWLTDPASLRIGYGPVCAVKAGIPHPTTVRTTRRSAPADQPTLPEETVTDTADLHAALPAAARRALTSLEDLIAELHDPGVEALGARYELATALGRVGKNEMPLDELGFSRDPQVIRQAALYEAARRLEDDDHLAAAAELREMASEAHAGPDLPF